MATRKPLVLVNGEPAELPEGDSVPLSDNVLGGLYVHRTFRTRTNGDGRWTIFFDGFAEVQNITATSFGGNGADEVILVNVTGFNQNRADGTVVRNQNTSLFNRNSFALVGNKEVIVTVIGR